MNIGILFPRSNTHPLIGADFLEGIKTFTKKEGIENEIKFYTESVGFGGTEKEVYAKAEKLLMVDEVDVLIGFIDEKILELIKPLILASGKLLLLVNPGANHPVNWVPQENIIALNLQHSFLCAVTGFRAAYSAPQVPAAVATTFYDCGYLHLASIVNGFQESKGSLRFNYVNNNAYNSEFNIIPLTDFLTANKDTRSLLCVFDSLPASLFYKFLNDYESSSGLQLHVSPMMLEKKALEHIGNGYHFSIQGYIPWHISAPTENNQQFVNYYAAQLTKEPSLFSLLGWETGMVLKEILVTNNGHYKKGEDIAEKLKAVVLNSPRGHLMLDPVTQYFTSPVIKCSLPAGTSTVQYEYDIKMESEWEEFSEKMTDGIVSGWTNTYLCY